MIVADILHSLTDKAVAEAAVASIGGEFAAALRDQAMRRGVTVGSLTVTFVSEFAVGASERDWRVLVSTMVGHDHPVLAGLRVIAERMLRRQDAEGSARLERRGRPAIPAPPYAAHLCSAMTIGLAEA